jgi:hypothetical protein
MSSFQPTLIPGLPSPYEQTRGLFYFPRMVAKIRLHARGALPAAYHENLGDGFDGRCVRFLGITYDALREEVLRSGDATDGELLEWCFKNGRTPNAEEIEIWNGFLSKRGWRDEASDLLRRRLREAGFPEEGPIKTFFDFLDVDEGRPLRS